MEPSPRSSSQQTTGTGQDPLVQIELKRRELGRRHGISLDPVRHYRRPQERPFTKRQKPSTTVLIGGLSPRHTRLIEAGLVSLGYDGRALPNASFRGYELAKEYGNSGLCNPAHFMVGTVVAYVQDLEASGMSRDEIIDSHVLMTTSSCGTCRFGMYESEHRLALGNAGFDGFRVVTIGSDQGIDQSSGEQAGLDLNLDFFIALLAAFDLGDVVSQYHFRVRPYEVEPGATDAAGDEAMDHLYDVLSHRQPWHLEDSKLRFLSGTRFAGGASFLGKLANLMRRTDLPDAMARVRRIYDRVELDPFRVKPVVKLTGEFWAQVAVGDGNLDMHRFLEREGAEVYVERQLLMRLSYMLFHHQRLTMDRKGVLDGKSRLEHYRWYYRKRLRLGLAERLLRRENGRLLAAMGDTLHPMPDHYELEELARPYWNFRTGSGESHLEIAENIYDHTHGLCHMLLSVKPFTCMPSTQSDGVQTKVVEHHPAMIFLPIETSGDGQVIAHSRVQMALGAARVRARKEFADALSKSGRTLEELVSFADDHPEVKRPSYKVPHHEGFVGRAANMALHVGALMGQRPASVPGGLPAVGNGRVTPAAEAVS